MHAHVRASTCTPVIYWLRFMRPYSWAPLCHIQATHGHVIYHILLCKAVCIATSFPCRSQRASGCETEVDSRTLASRKAKRTSSHCSVSGSLYIQPHLCVDHRGYAVAPPSATKREIHVKHKNLLSPNLIRIKFENLLSPNLKTALEPSAW